MRAIIILYLSIHLVSWFYLLFIIWGNIYKRKNFEPVFEIDMKKNFLYKKDGLSLCVLYALEALAFAPLVAGMRWAYKMRFFRR